MDTPDAPYVAPLEGIRVLEFASMLSGPYAGLLLNILGAEVIKVERTVGDPFRGYGGYSTHFANFNAGKLSVVADLTTEDGRLAVLELVKTADVVLENARPGQMERLGLGEAECRGVNPNLVYVGISGFGTSGPLADRPAYDAIGQSMSGLMDSITNGASPSVGPALGDILSGVVGASAALAGIAGRGLHGRGSTVRTSMVEALFCSISDALLHFAAHGTERTRADRATRSLVLSLEASDGRYVMVQLSSSQRFFENLLGAVEMTHLLDDPRFVDYASRMEHQVELQLLLEPVFRSRSSAEWDDVLSRADVPASPVLRVGDVMNHPHVEALQSFGVTDEDGSLRYRGPWLIDGHRPPTPAGAPGLGADTRAVFEAVLGKGTASDLIARGVLRTE